LRWVVTSDGKFKTPVELVLNEPDDDDGGFEVKFLKRSNKIRNGFVFSDREDTASAKRSGMDSVLSVA